MARIMFSKMKDFDLALERLEIAAQSDEFLSEAVYEGAAIVTDAIRANLEALPTEKNRILREGEQFDGVPTGQKRDLIDSFGLTPITRDAHGFVHAKPGFDGYGSFPTKKYPKGVPNQLVARAIESGSSVRMKHPFVRPAVNATRKRAIAAMETVIMDKIKKIMK